MSRAGEDDKEVSARDITIAAMAARIILHLDMDAFFAAIEQREDPSLVGRPVIIGHRGRRGVVATCSYEARRYGVHSAMPSLNAERLCPDAVWLQGRSDLYRETSQRIFTMLASEIPLIEQVSVDEAYGDLSGVVPAIEEAAPLARTLQAKILEDEGLSASIGVAGCRFLAKIASDLEKPAGLVLLRCADLETRIHPLSVQKIPGVGPKLAAVLQRRGFCLIGDLAAADEGLLRRHFGVRTGSFLAARARGEDDTPLENSHQRRSVSEERTYHEDLVDEETILRELLARSEGVAQTLRRKELCARTVILKARDARYRTVTRSVTLDEPAELTEEIYHAAKRLWQEKTQFHGRGVRLLGVGATKLIPRREIPPPLFPDDERERSREIARAADELRRRFGRDVIGPGRLL